MNLQKVNYVLGTLMVCFVLACLAEIALETAGPLLGFLFCTMERADSYAGYWYRFCFPILEPAQFEDIAFRNIRPMIFFGSIGLVLLWNARRLKRKSSNLGDIKRRSWREWLNQPIGGKRVTICHQCGAKMQPDNKYCRECGTKLVA
jgi:hypothetical protein